MFFSTANQKLGPSGDGKDGIINLMGRSLIFSQIDGSPLLPNTVTRAWIKLVRRNGLAGVRLHDSRHSHASLMLKQGIHPLIVSQRLGHSGIQVTLDCYSHLTPNIQEAAAKRFDELLYPRRENKGVENIG